MATVVDRIKVMAYEFSGATPGPIAPLAWDRTIIAATLSVVPAGKIVLGIPSYGKDWVTSIDGTCPAGISPRQRSLTSNNAPTLAYNHGKVPAWDAARAERTFSYYDTFPGNDAGNNFVSCNVYRTVWYMDAQGVNARVALAKSNGLAGVSFWALGGEEPGAWPGIGAATQGTAWLAPPYPVPPPASCPPPAVYSPPPVDPTQPPPPAPPRRNLPLGSRSPSASLDVVAPISCGVRVSGWAIDPNTDAPINIRVTVRVKAKTNTFTIAASERRDDVNQIFGRGWQHGFDISLPSAAGPARVCVTALNVGPGRNRLLGCRTVITSGDAPLT
jgi:Glycosyl hydrolases family 18